MNKKIISNVITANVTKTTLNCVLMLSVLLVAGCGKEASEEKHATQVAVKVNDSEITVHQINQMLQTSGSSNLPENAANKVLEGLIDQELLVQKAISNRLDRDPSIVMALENSRRQILSQSYVQKLVLDHSPITNKETQDYYTQHPDLFAKRRIYQFQVFSLETPTLDDTLKAALEHVSKPEQVKDLLKQNNIKYQEESVTKPAEQLPLEMLSSFANAKIGDIVITPAQSSVLLMQLTNSVERPVTSEQAKTQIEQFLVNTRNKETVDKHIKQLRAEATLVYQGDFANKDKPKEPVQPTNQEIASPADKKPESNTQKILESGFK